jgi:hypothetical protein
VDLGGAGVTPNDLLDADGGPNGQLNMPVLTSATIDGSDQITVVAKYHGAPSTAHALYLFSNAACDPSGHGEGEEPYPGVKAFLTDASGNAEMTIGPVPEHAGIVLSALVVRTSGARVVSEMSTCRTVISASSTRLFDDSFESGFVDAWSAWSL